MTAADPLAQLLERSDFLWRRPPAGAPMFSDIQWRTDACGPSSILFFQCLDNGLDDASLFARYLAGCHCGALVIDRQLDGLDRLPERIGVYVTRPGHWGKTLERFCDAVYPLPPACYLGVTGTNGKTTTVKYLESILGAQRQRVLTVGTLGIDLEGATLAETGFTSPPLIELRRILHEARGRFDTVAMELSSHALHQGRAYGIPLNQAAWTNFGQDHLDYHRNETAYFSAKASILDQLAPAGRLYCGDAVLARRLREHCNDPRIVAIDPPQLTPAALAAKPFLALAHNRANYALAVALAQTTRDAPLVDSWQALQAVPGRFECRATDNRLCVVDFAHTPDALASILGAIRISLPQSRVLTVFGCGGNRDRTKRPLMAAAVARHADHILVTSDNPRHEDPRAIIDDILAGFADPDLPQREVRVNLERASAIAEAFDWLATCPSAEHWVLLIAGKGHERYIDQDGHKRYFSDQDEVERNLRRLGWN